MEKDHRLVAARFWNQIAVFACVGLPVLVSSSGCSRWANRRPAAFTSATPSASEILAVTNRNAERARSLIAKDIDISSNQIPFPLDGRLALEKPRRFRLVAYAPVTHSTVADVGSNDAEF